MKPVDAPPLRGNTASSPTEGRRQSQESVIPMNRLTRGLAIVLPLAVLLSATAGCSHEQAATDSGQDLSWMEQGQAEDQFIAEVEKLPADQRKDYVASHREQLNQVQTDPDKSKLDKLDNLLPPEIP